MEVGRLEKRQMRGSWGKTEGLHPIYLLIFFGVHHLDETL